MQLTNYDPLDYLKDEEDFKFALRVAFEEDPEDGSLVIATLGDIAKAKGMTQLADSAGRRNRTFSRKPLSFFIWERPA